MAQSFRSKLRARIPRKGSFAANVLTFFTGSVVAQGLILASMPILTRLYTPEDFGALAVFTSIILLLAPIASWRYESAIILPEDKVTAASLLLLCLIILGGMSLLTWLGLWFLSDVVAGLLKSPTLKPYLWLIPLGLMGAGTYQVLNGWALRSKAFGTLARTRLSQSFGWLLASIGLGYFQLRPLGLLLGQVAGGSSGSVTLAIHAWRQDRESFKLASISRMREAAQRYKKFPIFIVAASLLNSAALQLPFFLLSAFYGPEIVGWFSLGHRAIATPVSVLMVSLRQGFVAEAAQLITRDQFELQRIFFKLAKAVCLPALLIGLASLLSPYIFPIIFGAKWTEAGVYTQLLTLMFITQFIATPISIIGLHELQHWQLLWDAGRVSLTGISFIVAHLLNFRPTQCIFTYAMAMSLSFVVLFFLNVRALRRTIKAKAGLS